MLTGGGEGILGGELPHACDELRKAANEEGHADDDVGVDDTPCRDVVHGEDEGRGREAVETAAWIDMSMMSENGSKTQTTRVGR